MNETWTTVTGHASSAVERRTTPRGARVVCFRMDVPERRYDAERAAWRERWLSRYTVWARQEMAVNLLESVVCGEPLVVHGKLRLPPGGRGTGAAQSRGGRDRPPGEYAAFAHIEAVAIGHNLAHGVSTFHRVARARRPLPPRGPRTGSQRGGLRTQGPNKSAFLTDRR
ncbi:single-stranded DNA-binding protein [Streptomyces otsuchiensis]|uniref:single-stranded DNA-binding protein n=1 Tax=Streptomyces otsuchiensis TaxID=2681388 RepID=UPI0013006FB9|nr:single-stranded DNA-binding protein [Streptomyces otsuchiensis]